jgi:hypothetical protein
VDCSKLDKIISTPSLGDSARRNALQKLIQNGCLKSLFGHAKTSSRIDWIRNYSLLALAKFASINIAADEVAITLQDDEILLDFSLDKDELKTRSAKLLLLFLTLENKPRKFKKIALMGLIVGEHWDYCKELEMDPDTEEWIQRTIQSALRTKK